MPTYARVARYQVPVERIEEALESFEGAVREIEEIEGLQGGQVLVDHQDGSIMTMTLWESRAALDAGESRATKARQDAVRAVEGSVLSVDRYEVATEVSATQPAQPG